MADILLNLEQLRTLRDDLELLVGEFDQAAQTNDQLENAINLPDGRTALKQEAHEFEDAWNDTRKILKGNLENVHKRLKDIVSGWTEWDEKARQSLEGK